MIKKVLVTGGAGFIGSHTVDLLLERNYHVTVIDDLSGGQLSNIEHNKDNPNYNFIQADINEINTEEVFFRDIEFIIHFAGIGDIVPSIEKPINYMQTNVLGTINILEAARKNNIKRFVYAASSSCYGIANVPTDENHKIEPMYPYALSKYQGEQAAFHWNKVYGISVNSIRIFNAYGPRVKTTGAYGAVFGVFFKQKLSNEPFTIVGDGTQSRDFVYVTDVAKAFILAAETNKDGEIFNLGCGQPQTINKLADIIKGKKIYLPKRPGEPDCTWANNEKITAILGWKPTISFEDGVNEMLKDIKNWENAPLWNSKTIEKATKTWFKYMNEVKN